MSTARLRRAFELGATPGLSRVRLGPLRAGRAGRIAGLRRLHYVRICPAEGDRKGRLLRWLLWSGGTSICATGQCLRPAELELRSVVEDLRLWGWTGSAGKALVKNA